MNQISSRSSRGVAYHKTIPSITKPEVSHLQQAQLGSLQYKMSLTGEGSKTNPSFDHTYEVEVERLVQSLDLDRAIASDTQKARLDLVKFRAALIDCNRKLRQEMAQKILQLEEEIDDYKRQLAFTIKKNVELTRISQLDELTQIANRRQFNEALELQWQQMTIRRQPLSLILCDVDYFKRYNDTYGHQMGDFCLKEISKTMSSMLKQSSGLVARYGGEEFVILLPNTYADEAMVFAEKVRMAIEQRQLPHPTSDTCTFVTLSIGVASTVPHTNTSGQSLLAQADIALYKAKNSGRNRVSR